jgi:hypothetical protein
MEATHLGALLKGQDAATVQEAIQLLATAAVLADSSKIIDKDGTIDPTLVAEIHKWATPAAKLLQAAAKVWQCRPGTTAMSR